MADTDKTSDKGALKVLVDEEFKADLDRAAKVTAIRNVSDLVRYCVRQVARGAA